MYIVYQKNPKSGLINIVDEFSSIEDLYKYFRKLHHDKYYFAWEKYQYLEDKFSHVYDEIMTYKVLDGIKKPIYKYVIENEHGLRFSYSYVKGEFQKIRKKLSIRFIWISTGYKRISRGGYFKHPKTLQEMKYSMIMDECEPKPRAKRNHKNLPNSYDDIPHSDYTRNWKKYRKTQWKKR